MRKWSNFQKTPCLLQKACYNSPVDERDCRETFRLVFAGVAQLAEHDVANVVVEGSNPFARSYGGFSGFGHGFRWKQLVPEHLAMPPLSVGTNGAPLFWGALFLRAPRFYPRSSGKTGKRPRFRVFSFFLTALS